MHPVIEKTFGGLSKPYYFRQLFFGAALFAFAMFMATRTPDNVPFITLLILGINTLLYPYARFVYESVVSFLVGDNTFVAPLFVMMFFKLLTMLLCWCFAIFIAPIGLAYLYFHHSKSE